MSTTFDYLWNAPWLNGGGILAPPQPASPPVGGLLSTASTATPPGQPTLMAGMNGLVDFFQNNPALISTIAAGIGSAPTMRMGIAQAASGVPQARQADNATQGRMAMQSYFKSPDVAKSYSPALLNLMQKNPEFGQAILANTVGAKPQWGVVSEDPYTGTKQYGWIDVANQSVRPYTGTSIFDQPAGGPGGASPQPAGAPPAPQPAWRPGGAQAVFGGAPGLTDPASPGTARPGVVQTAAGRKMTGVGPTFDGLPPDYQQLAIKMYQGKVPFETARQLGMTPLMYAHVIEAANDYAQHNNDSTGFDAVNWQNRLKTVENFNAANTSPNSPGFAIGKGRTSIGHLDQLSSLIDKLPDSPTGNIPFVAGAVRRFQEATARGTNSDLAGTLSAWDQTVGLLASELTNFYRGGGGNEADIQRFIERLDAASSKTELYNAVTSAVDLMKSRIGSYQDQWHSAMGRGVPDFEIFTPTAVGALDRIKQRADQGLAKARGGPSTTTPQAIPEGATATGPNGEKAIFRGGRWINQATGMPL